MYQAKSADQITTDTVNSTICQLIRTGAPLVFHGTAVFNKILEQHGFTLENFRISNRIEAYWTAECLVMSEITKTVTAAVDKVNPCFTAAPLKAKIVNNKAPFAVLDGTRNVLMLDICIQEYSGYTGYAFGEVTGCGESMVKMLADRIYSVSTDTVYTHCADLYDLYMFSKIPGHRLGELNQRLSMSKQKLGRFRGINEQDSELRIEYFKFSAVQNKPEFADVCRRVTEFVRPFKHYYTGNLVWTGENWVRPADAAPETHLVQAVNNDKYTVL